MHELVIIVAKFFIVIPILAVAWVLFNAPKKERIRLAGLLILGGVLTVVFAKIGSNLYYDPRPFVYGHITPYFSHGPDNGFPSDHTLLAAFLAYWTFLLNKSLGIALFIVALLIGTARIVAHVHHLNDILGSLGFAAVGILAAYFINYVLNRFTQNKQVE